MASWLEKQRDKVKREKLAREMTHEPFTPPDNPMGDQHGNWSGSNPNKSQDAMVIKDANGVNEIAIIDPRQIRSRFAAFDPMQRNSANILAGGAAGAVGLSSLADLLYQPEYQQ